MFLNPYSGEECTIQCTSDISPERELNPQLFNYSYAFLMNTEDEYCIIYQIDNKQILITDQNGLEEVFEIEKFAKLFEPVEDGVKYPVQYPVQSEPEPEPEVEINRLVEAVNNRYCKSSKEAFDALIKIGCTSNNLLRFDEKAKFLAVKNGIIYSEGMTDTSLPTMCPSEMQFTGDRFVFINFDNEYFDNLDDMVRELNEIEGKVFTHKSYPKTKIRVTDIGGMDKVMYTMEKIDVNEDPFKISRSCFEESYIEFGANVNGIDMSKTYADVSEGKTPEYIYRIVACGKGITYLDGTNHCGRNHSMSVDTDGFFAKFRECTQEALPIWERRITIRDNQETISEAMKENEILLKEIDVIQKGEKGEIPQDVWDKLKTEIRAYRKGAEVIWKSNQSESRNDVEHFHYYNVTKEEDFNMFYKFSIFN